MCVTPSSLLQFRRTTKKRSEDVGGGQIFTVGPRITGAVIPRWAGGQRLQCCSAGTPVACLRPERSYIKSSLQSLCWQLRALATAQVRTVLYCCCCMSGRSVLSLWRVKTLSSFRRGESTWVIIKLPVLQRVHFFCIHCFVIAFRHYYLPLWTALNLARSCWKCYWQEIRKC